MLNDTEQAQIEKDQVEKQWSNQVDKLKDELEQISKQLESEKMQSMQKNNETESERESLLAELHDLRQQVET